MNKTETEQEERTEWAMTESSKGCKLRNNSGKCLDNGVVRPCTYENCLHKSKEEMWRIEAEACQKAAEGLLKVTGATQAADGKGDEPKMVYCPNCGEKSIVHLLLTHIFRCPKCHFKMHTCRYELGDIFVEPVDSQCSSTKPKQAPVNEGTRAGSNDAFETFKVGDKVILNCVGTEMMNPKYFSHWPATVKAIKITHGSGVSDFELDNCSCGCSGLYLETVKPEPVVQQLPNVESNSVATQQPTNNDKLISMIEARIKEIENTVIDKREATNGYCLKLKLTDQLSWVLKILREQKGA